jgi:hypothetical protein
VGLVWAGSADNARGAGRSLRLEALRPLLQLPGLTFVSLQKGAAEAELDALPEGERVVRLGRALRDFADTACAVRELDLVVTIDTSVAHLAGALAAPTWVLLSHDACWRWGLEEHATPWYPTARLFRQPAPGEWRAVAERVACELARQRHAAA